MLYTYSVFSLPCEASTSKVSYSKLLLTDRSGMWGSTGKSHLNGSWVLQFWLVTNVLETIFLSVSGRTVRQVHKTWVFILCYMATGYCHWQQILQWNKWIPNDNVDNNFYSSRINLRPLCHEKQCIIFYLSTTCDPRTIQSSGLCNSCKINKYRKPTYARTLLQTLILKGVYHIKYPKYKMCLPIHILPKCYDTLHSHSEIWTSFFY